MIKKSPNNEDGFTLLEMIVVITIMSTLAATYAPRLIAAKQRQALAQEVGKNITMLIDAAKLFHLNDPDGDGADWPANIAELQAFNYINPGWSPNHAFGGNITLGTSGPNLQVTVSNLPSDIQNVVRQAVPGWSYNAGALRGISSVPPPGQEPSLAVKVDRAGDDMWGDLVMTQGADIRVQDSGGNDRILLGEQGGAYGLHGVGANGDVWLRANTAGASGRLYLQSRNGIQILNAAGNVIATISNTGRLTVQDAILSGMDPLVRLGENRQWLVYMGLHRNNDLVTAPTLGGSYANATYRIFVVPAFFEGAPNLGADVYPVNSVRCWAESVAAGRWRVRIRVQDSLNRVHQTTNNQRALVLVMAQV
jgi:prepilin-type N-terminal cleavage/methylation domain-containing protein